MASVTKTSSDLSYQDLERRYQELEQRVIRFSATEKRLSEMRNAYEIEIARFQALHDFGLALLKANSLSDCANIAVEHLVDIFEIEAAAIGLLDEAEGTITYLAHCDLPDHERYLKVAPIIVSRLQEADFGKATLYTKTPLLEKLGVSDIIFTMTRLSCFDNPLIIAGLTTTKNSLRYLQIQESIKGAFELACQKITSTFLNIFTSENIRQKDAKLAQQQFYQGYHAIFNAINDLLLVIEEDTLNIKEVNKKLLTLSNYPRDHFIGMPLIHWAGEIDPENYPTRKLLAYCKGVTLTKKTAIFEWPLPSSDPDAPFENFYWAEISVNKVTLLEKDYLVFVVRDISQHKKLESSLVELAHEANVASEAKSNFLANMTHEIRTPMNAIIGMTQLFLDTNLSHEQREMAETVRTNAILLLNIIDDIFDFSKIEKGDINLNLIEFDFYDLIGRLNDTFGEKAQLKNLVSSTAIDPRIPQFLLGDPDRIFQILRNLLDNAIKFTPAGEVNVRCELKHQENNQVTLDFFISDTGIGISSDKIKHIFTPFNQIDNSAIRKYSGTGLGLSISKRLITMMAGDIDVSSDQNGTQFHFNIQLSTSEKTNRIDFSKPFALSVLINEPHAGTRHYLETLLMAMGCKAIEIQDENRLFEILFSEKATYDVAIINSKTLYRQQKSLIKWLETRKEPYTRLVMTLPMIRQSHAIVRQKSIDALLSLPLRMEPLYNILQGFHADAQSTQRTRCKKNSSCKILLVEDNPVNQKLAVKVLEKIGFMPEIASNGFEAIKKATSQHFNLVLMDIQMPELDGIEATRRIRGLEKDDYRVPIIALTANTTGEDRQAYFAAGMDDIVSKPFRIEQLQRVISKWLNITESD